MVEVIKFRNGVFEIPDNSMVKITKIKNHFEMMSKSNPSTGNINYIRKLNKDEYVLKDTGEIKKFNHSSSRKENLNNVCQTLKKLRNLINNNFSGDIEHEKMVTVTYKENMKDVKKLYKDLEKFVKRVRYKLGYFDYLFIVEPQGRGAWHLHALMKFRDVIGFIDNKVISDLWGKGFITVKAIKGNVNNIGAYLSAYLANIEYTDKNVNLLVEKGLNKADMIKKDIEVNGKNKRFIKGGRLYLYPPGINIFRKSKGIIYPEVEIGQKSILVKKYKKDLKNEVYKEQIFISDNKEGKSFLKTLYYVQYKSVP